MHHRDAVRERAGQQDVVGDQQIADARLRLQICQQIEDLRADRNIGARQRFHGDDDRGLGGERPCDRQTLPLTAAQLAGIARQERRGGAQLDALQRGADTDASPTAAWRRMARTVRRGLNVVEAS